MDAALDKAAARLAAKARRAALAGQGAAGAAEASARSNLAEALAPFAGLPLAGYLPIGSEIDPLPILAGWQGEVALPVVEAKAAPLGFRRWRPGEALIAGGFGTRIPEAEVPVIPRLLIVPLLAFDARGYRLGYGGGFYDRTLAMLRAERPTLAIGFAFEGQYAPASLPTDAFDQRLDLIVTESRIRRF